MCATDFMRSKLSISKNKENTSDESMHYCIQKLTVKLYDKIWTEYGHLAFNFDPVVRPHKFFFANRAPIFINPALVNDAVYGASGRAFKTAKWSTCRNVELGVHSASPPPTGVRQTVLLNIDSFYNEVDDVG